MSQSPYSQFSFSLFVVLWKKFFVCVTIFCFLILFVFFIDRILLNQEKAFNFRYDFIFDRTRAIRQEIVMQNFSCEKTLRILEPIVMFLSFSLFRLNGSSMAIFDSKICTQHLQECLLKCLTCYDELERDNQHVYSMNNRIIIEGIYVMLYIQDATALQRAIRLNPQVKASFIVKMSIEICLNFHLRNYYRVLRDIQQLPHLLAAIASLKLPNHRMEILHAFSIAYNSKSLDVPIDFLQRLLIYDEMKFLVRDLRDLGIHEENEEKPTKVIFNRMKFDRSKLIVSRNTDFWKTGLIATKRSLACFFFSFFIFSQAPRINLWRKSYAIIIYPTWSCLKTCKNLCACSIYDSS